MEMSVYEIRRSGDYAELSLEPTEGSLPEISPGQFVNIQVPQSHDTFLRRPISIYDVVDGTLLLIVKDAGPATHALVNSKPGDVYNILLPLGHGFTCDKSMNGKRCLLIGGGVGIAPLLYLGSMLEMYGAKPEFLLGGRTASDLEWQLKEYRDVATTHICTEDGSIGERGFVTAHEVLSQEYDIWYVCGPMPMMKAVAAIARERGIECEVSLENKMACGVGACLCCVEDTADSGNVCTCTEGPVFNINRLKW